jgi:hypothetical protein
MPDALNFSLLLSDTGRHEASWRLPGSYPLASAGAQVARDEAAAPGRGGGSPRSIPKYALQGSPAASPGDRQLG